MTVLITDEELNWQCVSMPAGNAYPFRHLVQSLLGLAYAPLLRPVFPYLLCLFSAFHLEYIPRYSLDFA